MRTATARGWHVLVGVAVLAAAALSGCATGGAAGGQVRERQNRLVHIVQTSDRIFGRTAHVRTVHADSMPSGTTEWSAIGIDPASSTVTMSWVDGPGPKCGEVDRVGILERTDAVVVGLVDSARDAALNCAAVGVPRHFELRLRRPLGARAMLEPVTGVNDGLPHFALGEAPVPRCSTDATPMDSPIGMPDARRRLAPTTATSAVVCRTAWPKGVARTTAVAVKDAASLRRIVSALNAAPGLTASTTPAAACASRLPGAWYAVYLSGPGMQVEVFVDQINCGVMENGAVRAPTTSRVDAVLSALFAPP